MISRRTFLRALGTLGAGLIVEPMIEPFIVPERKIWVVGAQLDGSLAPRRVVFPTFEIAHPTFEITHVFVLPLRPVRQGLTILPADDPKRRAIDLVMEDLL